MSNILSKGKDIVFGDEQKIAKPISQFTGIGFNAPGLSVDTSKGRFDLNRSSENQTALDNLSGAFGNLSGEIGALKPLVSPAFGELTRVGSQAIEDNRRKTVGDLRQNLSRRKVLGSSFAADDVSRTNAEFAKRDAEFRATTKLQEIEATAQLITQQYDAAAKSASVILDQGNFESTLAAELSRQYTSALAELAKFESELLRDEADGITAAIGAGTTALLGGALGSIGAGLFGGSGAAGAAAGGAAAVGGGFGVLGTKIPGVGTVGGIGAAAGAGFIGNRLATLLPGDQNNIESNIGGAVGTGLGSVFGPAGALAGGFIGTELGSLFNEAGPKGKALAVATGGLSLIAKPLTDVAGITGRGGGEDKADYSIGVNPTGTSYKTGLSAEGVWGSVGLGSQKHIKNTDSFQQGFDAIIKSDEALSSLFTPEENAAIKAEIEKGGIISKNSNEGGFSPSRMMKAVFSNRAQAIQRVIGPEAFAEKGLDRVYAALASGDQDQINAVIGAA